MLLPSQNTNILPVKIYDETALIVLVFYPLKFNDLNLLENKHSLIGRHLAEIVWQCFVDIRDADHCDIVLLSQFILDAYRSAARS